MKTFAPLLLLLFIVGCHREPPAQKGPLFDVPSLIGKTQSEVEKQLGAPVAPNTWQKDNTKLTAQWSQSGLLTGFLLESNDPLKDEKRDAFLKRANLKENDSHYQISFVEAPDKVFYFTGAQVQLPSTHEVELRVEGPEVLVSVSANGEEFTTVPPWDNSDKKLQVSIGQQIVLEASLFPTKKTPPSQPLKLQILVDGRVLKEESKPYEAQCALVL
jgi:hypothetical protein